MAEAAWTRLPGQLPGSPALVAGVVVRVIRTIGCESGVSW